MCVKGWKKKPCVRGAVRAAIKTIWSCLGCCLFGGAGVGICLLLFHHVVNSHCYENFFNLFRNNDIISSYNRCGFSQFIQFCVALGLISAGAVILHAIFFICWIRLTLKYRKEKCQSPVSLSSVVTENYQDIIKYIQESPYIETIQSEIEQNVVRLVNNTWIYQKHCGKDARALTHNKLVVKHVLEINNEELWNIYESKRHKTKNDNYPDEIRYKPIRTTTAETSFLDDVYPKDGPLSNTSKHRRLETNEIYLFHGTRVENIQGIIAHGFDLARARKGLYGKAIYMAESCEKADQYADDLNQRRQTDLAMLVVRVTLGRVYCHTTDKTVKVPSKGFIGVRRPAYDTVIAGINKRFREFLVFDAKQCYPEFIVIYDRQY